MLQDIVQARQVNRLTSFISAVASCASSAAAASRATGCPEARFNASAATPSAPSNSGCGGTIMSRPTIWAKALASAELSATPPWRNTF
jgi:hypothetical protein